MAVKAAMSAGTRRWVYGLNVAVTIVLAVALAAFVIWGAASYGGRRDWTRAGVNSLSPRTVQLLRGLDQDITITGLYSTALKEIRPHAEKHQKRVADALDLYETAGHGKLNAHMIDASESPAKVTELLKRLAEKPAYKDESAPHAQALATFPELSARIIELTQHELTQLETLGGADPGLGQIRELATVERFFRGIIQGAHDTETDVATLRAEEVPRCGAAVELAQGYLEDAQKVLQEVQGWMTANGASMSGIGAEARNFFATASQRYEAINKDIEAQLEKMKGLEGVELENIHNDLKRGQTVLVETAQEAVVLSQDDVWPWRTDRNAPAPPDGDLRDFAGEQAISSAILRMTQKDKTAVIFTRFGGQPLLRPLMPPGNPMMRMPQAPYQAINELLEKENFVTEEWDVQTQEQPPQVEDAARTIYVVFPPEPPQQPDPMRPAPTPRISPEQKQRIFDAVAASEMAVFLTRWAPPRSQFMPIPETYEFKDYLKSSWGVEVHDTHLALQFTINPATDGLKFPAGRNALITSAVFHYTDQPIGQPLRGLQAAFQMVSPLSVVSADELPEGVALTPVAEVNDTEDVWAIKDLNRINDDLQKNQGTRRYEDDIAAPFPLAIAGTSEKGGKLVVFASDRFMADAVLNMSQLVQVGGSLRLAKLYPGNVDLFINALHWLTGNADRIAVGPQRSDVPRLDELKNDATLTFTRVFLVGIWPAVALIVGAGVWLVRRR